MTRNPNYFGEVCDDCEVLTIADVTAPRAEHRRNHYMDRCDSLIC
jgi:hypothetical protein